MQKRMSLSSGYTLIEMLISSVIIVSVLGAAIGAMTLIVINKNKTAARIALKREGEYALQTIIRALTPGAMVVDCNLTPTTEIEVRGREGQSNLVVCDPNPDPMINELSLNGDDLINPELNYMLTSCSISCNNIDRAYQRYQIDFSYTLRDTARNFEMPFASQINLRN